MLLLAGDFKLQQTVYAVCCNCVVTRTLALYAVKK